MMAKPILLNSSTYNTIKVLSMGRMITSIQRRKRNSKGNSYPAGSGRVAVRLSCTADVS